MNELPPKVEQLLHECSYMGIVSPTTLYKLGVKHGDKYDAMRDELAEYAYASRHDTRKRFVVRKREDGSPFGVVAVAQDSKGAVTLHSAFCQLNDACHTP